MGIRGWWFAVLACLPLLGSGAAQGASGEAVAVPQNPEPVSEAQLPAWFKSSFLDLGEDIHEAASQGRRLLLYFHQNGCPYCKKLLEDNFGNAQIAAHTRRLFDVIAINMWGDRSVTTLDGRELSEKAFAAERRVMYTPTLLFLDERGETVLRLNGYYQPARFSVALDYAAGRAPAGQGFAEYLRRRLDAAPGTQRDTAPHHIEVRREPFMISPPYALARNHISAQRPLLVLFEQTDCAACDEFHRDVLSRAGIRKRLEGFDVVGLDRWADTPLITPEGERSSATRWAARLKVNYTPSLVFFDSTGQEVFRAEAYLKTFHTGAVLDYVSSGAYRHQPSFQRFVQEVADRMRERGERVDLWQ